MLIYNYNYYYYPYHMDNNNNYKKITFLKGDKILSAFEIKKKKTHLIYCKKFLKKLTRTNSNTSTHSIASNDSESSNDQFVRYNSPNNINIIIDKN